MRLFANIYIMENNSLLLHLLKVLQIFQGPAGLWFEEQGNELG